MGRVVAVFLLAVSLTCSAQTPKASDTVPARVNLDPAVPVVGASTPLNVLTQPSAPGETPAVVPEYRVATPLVPSGPPADAIVPSAPAETAFQPSASSANVGSISYASSAPAAGPSNSVADAAAQYRTNKAGMKSRVIDNNSLSVLDKNPSGLVTANELTMPQSDLSPEEEAALRHAKPEHAAGGDVLDPRDLAAVEAAVRRGEQQPDPAAQVASTQFEQMAREADAQLQTADAASSQSASTPQAGPSARPDEEQRKDQRKDQRDRLPESSTGLPFVALLGFMALTGAVVSVLRARA